MNCPRCGKPIADTYDHMTQSEERDYDHLCWEQWGGECEGDEPSPQENMNTTETEYIAMPKKLLLVILEHNKRLKKELEAADAYLAALSSLSDYWKGVAKSSFKHAKSNDDRLKSLIKQIHELTS